MKTYTREELDAMLSNHAKWLHGDDGGSRADLSRADLSRADLSRADLSRADLSCADLSRADLSGADLSRADLSGAGLSGAKIDPFTRIDTGETWGEYLSETVPALLAAGGKTVAAIVGAGAWKCHSWTNCPMAEAFSVHELDKVPILYRPRAQQFIRFFDAGLIPEPAAPEAGKG